jgi:hypothetical protein
VDIKASELGEAAARDLGTVYRDLEALFIADAVRDGALDRTRRFCDAPAYQALDRLRGLLALAWQAELLAGALETGSLEIRGPGAEEILDRLVAAADKARVVGP